MGNIAEIADAFRTLEDTLKKMGASGKFKVTLPIEDRHRLEYSISCAGLYDTPDLTKKTEVWGHEIKLERFHDSKR